MQRLLFYLAITIISFQQNHAQTSFEGKAIYQSQRDFKMKVDGQISKERKGKMQLMLDKLSKEEYVLLFNRNESIYKEKVQLSKPAISSGKVSVISVGSKNNAAYRNISTKKWIREESILGKAFLVKGKTQKPAWELVNETKKIGKYLCFKAVLKKEVEVSNFFLNKTKEIKPEKPKTKIETTIVWYTPQIPVRHGPGRFWGLPGLIMEVQKEGSSLMCTKVILNPKEGVEIQVPNTGKEIGQEEFYILEEKKMKEWMERHAVKDGDGGFSIHIQK